MYKKKIDTCSWSKTRTISQKRCRLFMILFMYDSRRLFFFYTEFHAESEIDIKSSVCAKKKKRLRQRGGLNKKHVSQNKRISNKTNAFSNTAKHGPKTGRKQRSSVCANKNWTTHNQHGQTKYTKHHQKHNIKPVNS